MTDTRLLNRLAETDAYPTEVPLPEEAWTSAVALQEIERRAERQPESGTGAIVRPVRSTRRLVLAAAAFAVVVAAVLAVVVWASDRQDLPDVTNEAPLTPLEVGNALNAAIVSGDATAWRSLYADDATYTVIDSGVLVSAAFRHGQWRGGSSDPSRPVERPLSAGKGSLNSALGTAFPPFDWIPADGATTNGFDDLAVNSMAMYAQGVTRVWSCTQADLTTVVCAEVLDGHAFLSEPLPPMTDTFTVVDGLITHQEYDTSGVFLEPDTFPLRLDYQDYIASTRPELEDVLFNDLARLLITPDTVETHRQLIAEWSVQG